MGAEVTSVDISQAQLDTARERARHLGLDITFVCSDVSQIETLSDNSFDLVYTGGGVCVWISDLDAYYLEGARLLKPGGLFIINDTHPFSDPWKSNASGSMVLEFGYFDRGPHIYDATQKSPDLLPDSKQYEFHWTISDRITALLKANWEKSMQTGSRSLWQHCRKICFLLQANRGVNIDMVPTMDGRLNPTERTNYPMSFCTLQSPFTIHQFLSLRLLFLRGGPLPFGLNDPFNR